MPDKSSDGKNSLRLIFSMKFAVLMASSVIISALIVSLVWWQINRGRNKVTAEKDNQITVKGSFKKSIVSDLAKWNCTLSRFARNYADGAKQFEADINKVRAFLRKKGVKDKDVAISDVKITTAFNEQNRNTEYRFAQEINIISKDVDAVTDVSRTITEFIYSGLTQSRTKWSFTLSRSVKDHVKGANIFEADVEKAKAFLAERGFKDGEGLVGSAVRIRPDYRDGSEELVGYVFSKDFIVSSTEEKTINSLTHAFTQYVYTELNKIKCKWRCVVMHRAVNLAEGANLLAADMKKVKAFLKGKGLKDSEIKESAVEIVSNYKRGKEGVETNEIENYSLNQDIDVVSEDVEKVIATSLSITDLIKDGIFIDSSRPEKIKEGINISHGKPRMIKEGITIELGKPKYVYTKLDDIKKEVIAEASKNARDRGDRIVSGVGGELGALRKARVGVLQITPKYSTEVSDYGINDTSSKDKDVTAVVELVFGFK